MQPAKKPSTNSSIKKPGSVPKGATLVKKEEIKPKTGFTEFPSAKLMNIKTADPFSEKKGNSFAHLYSSGAIPCKIEHGSVSMKLRWNSEVEIASKHFVI